MKRTASLASLLVVACLHAAPSPPSVLELRNRGFAELENEQPAKAEELFAELIELKPDDPLGHANLAVAALRQQKFEEGFAAIGRALELAPGDGALLAIRADLLQWSGESDEALAVYQAAAAASPADVESQYALYRHLTTVIRDPDQALVDGVLARLVELRPENLVVLLQQGRNALESGDRATASRAFLRIGELLWQAPPGSDRQWETVIEALEGDDLAAARLPAQRLENVLKITPMYRESLRELSTGIQGTPVRRFRDEPPADSFGEPATVRFSGSRIAVLCWVGDALAVGDFDGDQKPDVARVGAGEAPELEIRLSGGALEVAHRLPAGGVSRLLATDLDNDGALDLLGIGAGSARFWRGAGDGSLTDATVELGLEGISGLAAAVFDFDIEGDLDVVVAGEGLELLVNNLQGPLQARGAEALPELEGTFTATAVSDFDRDGDLDLAIAGPGELRLLDNLRQGRFLDLTATAGLGDGVEISALTTADMDNDGFSELIAVGSGARVFHNRRGRFEPWAPASTFETSARLADVAAFDADNDGRLDLAFAGAGGLAVAAQRSDGFRFLPLEAGPSEATAIVPADFDGDGDLDLVAQSTSGLWLMTNEGGNANHWLTVRLQGLTKGNSKNNVLGVGAVVEVRSGAAFQFREVAGDAVHFGLGDVARADLLRVVWTNGVPQNRLDPQLDQRIVEEQLLKGSCPFLYVLAGGEVRFVTDLLWNAPAGLPLAPDFYAPADPEELVKIGEIEPTDGAWDLRITEELWEAAFFDYTRLWVVDHPAEVEVASSLKVAPGERGPDRVLGTADVRPVAAAWDAAGREVTEIVRRRDEVYADGWRKSPYQGVAADPWVFTIDLGTAPGAPIRLLLEGWIFPADASLNLAVAQRDDLTGGFPSLEVEVDGSWQTLLPAIGHPAGKTKTMVVDTPRLPQGARRLRIAARQWLSWDRIAWSLHPADGEPLVAARLAPSVADLGYRGFSTVVRQAPNAPHAFDYGVVRTESPWLPFPGRYTRFGDVRELLAASDDRSVIMAAGDELRLLFDASHVAPPPAGWRRTLFLESHGWDKDADRNTFAAEAVEPLPFRSMTRYGEAFPDEPWAHAYRDEWLTRVVTSQPGR